jgi:hypothetical protein
MCITCGEHRIKAPYCECAPGYYEDPYTYFCVKCRPECLTCADGDSCIECVSICNEPLLEGEEPKYSNRHNPELGCPCKPKFWDEGICQCTAVEFPCKEVDLDGNCIECVDHAGPVPECPCYEHRFPAYH